ncbi:MAG TPA: YggT family protein [Thermoleophilaceae bacterium]|nr:YggT family protein [Thermoleophilaceae bacterium]
MSLWLAVSRQDIADYVETLTLVYLVLIFVRIIMSWIPRIPYNRFLAGFLKFVTDVTDPYLNLFRRILPPVRIGPGALDLSPIVATFVLILVSGFAVNLIAG